MSDIPKPVESLTLAEAARWLNIDEAALNSLIRVGFINVVIDGEVTLAEVKAFAARNSHGSEVAPSQQREDFNQLIEELDKEIDDLSQGAEAIFTRAVPETRQWTEAQRTEFVQQARARFGAILAVTAQGAQVDSALRQDLEEVGANAAWAGSSLPHLQLVLRISRDLLLQRAMKISERRNANIDGFVARLLPAIDNLIDAIASGYWGALLDGITEEHSRLASLVENVPYPIYEADMDGLLRHVNVAFCRMFDREADDLIGVPLGDVIKPIEGEVASLLAEPKNDVGRASVVVHSPIGGAKVKLEVDTVVRRVEGSIEGFAGLMRIRRAD